MSTTLRIVTKEPYFDNELWHPIKLFLDEWLTSICRDEYTVYTYNNYDAMRYELRIAFSNSEDAVIVRLKELPIEFSKHIELC